MNRNRSIVFKVFLLGLVVGLGALLLRGGELAGRQRRDAALYAAVRRSDLAAVKELLREHADPNCRAPVSFSWAFWRAPSTEFRPCALRNAIDQAASQAVFASAGAASSSTSVADAQAIVIALLDAGARVAPDDSGPNLLEEALSVAGHKLTPAIESLIGHGVPLPATLNGEPLLTYAILRGNSPETIDALLKAGADAKDAAGRAAITAAYTQVYLGTQGAHGRERMLRSLLAAGADPNTPISKSDPSTLLYDAVRSQHPHIVRLLIQAHADLNRAPYGEPPLLYRALEGTPEIMQSLLDAGADPNVRQSDGEPLLWYALIHSMSESAGDKARKVQLLLTHGAKVHTKFATTPYGTVTVLEAAHRGVKDWHIAPSLLTLLDRAAEREKALR